MTRQEQDAVLVENLRETLRQIQHYTVWGIGSSLSYLILATTDLGSTRAVVPVPGSFVSVNTELAKLIALVVFWVVGLMAAYSYQRARVISNTLESNLGLLQAALTFPSIVTEFSPLLRLSAALIPTLLVLSGRFFEGLPSADGEWWIFWGILLLLPYICFASFLLFWSLPMANLPKYRAEDRRAQHGGDQDE